MSPVLRSFRFLAAAALAAAASAARVASAQTPEAAAQRAPDVFENSLEQVKVDVVVTDKRGVPITGLTRDDFTILDEGAPQRVVSFERMESAPAPAVRPADLRPAVGSNQAAEEESGRAFVIVFDDLHMAPAAAYRAKIAVATFLERAVRNGDRITLLATGGGAWWSARMPEGRADLIATLKHLSGRRFPEKATERMTDWEAMRIFIDQDVSVSQRVAARWDQFGVKQSNGMRDAANSGGINTPDMYVNSRAAETYNKLKNRMQVTLGVLRRVLDSLSDARQRKAVLLVSEGFVYDTNQEDAFKDVTQAARRANTALYFVDASELQGVSGFSAEFQDAPPEQDLMRAIADVSLEGEGAAALADTTGGFSIRSSNDLAGALSKISRESESYYVLGYEVHDIPRDGRFRKIEVRVRGKNLVVRARKGYFAPSDRPAPPKAATRAIDAQLQHALDSPAALGAIPLRMTTYALETVDDRARVLVAVEVDLSKLPLATVDGTAAGSLDTLVGVVHRDSEDVFRNDQKVDLQVKKDPQGGPVWYSFTREFELAAGSYQAKLVVREPISKRIGTLLYEFDVPPLDALRVSTPILTDILQRAPGTNGLVPAILVRRTFPSGGTLYCRFNVYGASKGPNGMPRVSSGHVIRRLDGGVVATADPTVITPTSIGALARMVQIPLASLAPGDYALALTVRDELGGQERDIVAPFSVAGPAVAAR